MRPERSPQFAKMRCFAVAYRRRRQDIEEAFVGCVAARDRRRAREGWLVSSLRRVVEIPIQVRKAHNWLGAPLHYTTYEQTTRRHAAPSTPGVDHEIDRQDVERGPRRRCTIRQCLGGRHGPA